MKKNHPLAFLTLGKQRVKTSSVLLEEKVVLITGATSGIGLAAAHRFAKAKAHLILLARNSDKVTSLQVELKSTYGVKVDVYVADFSELTKLKQVLLLVQRNHAKIDVLINNAGVHSTRKVMTPSGYELGLTVNHLASFMVTDMLMNAVKQSDLKKIIQVNSEGHRFSGFPIHDPNFLKRTYTGLRSYGASKTAQLLTMWELAKLYFDEGIKIIAMHPGAVHSNIGQNNGWLYRLFKKVVINRLLKTVNQSAEALYYLASDPSLKDVTGQYFHLTSTSEPAKHALPSPYAKEVWQWTKQVINQF